MNVRPKKHLGQHFLHSKEIALKIVDSLSYVDYNEVLEIGPGKGILTEFLLGKEAIQLSAVEIDKESVDYLNEHYPKLKVYNKDFLKMSLDDYYKNDFAIIGNFPYNISTQILFKMLDFKSQVIELTGMFQKEVARRICSESGNKEYGILSVLTQTYYQTEYLFTVSEGAFFPPPKVKSGVIRLKRKENQPDLDNYTRYKQLVKAAFNQRRKKLSNALKSYTFKPEASKFLSLRAEQLSIENFIELYGLCVFEN